MDELYLKQLIKSFKKHGSLIIFLLGFSLVIFTALNLILFTSINEDYSGQISEYAASTELSFLDNKSDSDLYIIDDDKKNIEPESEYKIIFYTVKENDSTWKIANKFLGEGTRYIEIEKLNNLKHNQWLDIGQVVFIQIKPSYNIDLVDGEIDSEICEMHSEIINKELDSASDTCIYIIKEADSLWKIASKYYSNPLRWPEIYQLNKSIIGSDHNLIFSSVEIRLPK